MFLFLLACASSPAHLDWFTDTAPCGTEASVEWGPPDDVDLVVTFSAMVTHTVGDANTGTTYLQASGTPLNLDGPTALSCSSPEDVYTLTWAIEQ